jgi:hypothetical protein
MRGAMNFRPLSIYNSSSIPGLWSSYQSLLLKMQRFWVRFPALPHFLCSSGPGRSTQPLAGNWEATWMKSSGSVPEYRDNGRGDPLRWPRNTPPSAKVGTNSIHQRRPLKRYSYLVDLEPRIFCCIPSYCTLCSYEKFLELPATSLNAELLEIPAISLSVEVVKLLAISLNVDVLELAAISQNVEVLEPPVISLNIEVLELLLSL